MLASLIVYLDKYRKKNIFSKISIVHYNLWALTKTAINYYQTIKYLMVDFGY